MSNTQKIEETVTKIIDWEIENRETIVEFFINETVDIGAWAYWLLAKGYVKHANNIIMELLADNESMDPQMVYHVYDENDTDVHLSEENMIKNIELMAEFLVQTPKYLEKLNDFLEK